MTYRKRLGIDQFGLRDLAVVTVALSLVFAVGAATDWWFAVLGLGTPLLGLSIALLSYRARTKTTADRLAGGGALLLAVWVVFGAIPTLIAGVIYVARYLSESAG